MDPGRIEILHGPRSLVARAPASLHLTHACSGVSYIETLQRMIPYSVPFCKVGSTLTVHTSP